MCIRDSLYLYGPGSEAVSEEEYGIRYPGDEYVDVIGFDMYDICLLYTSKEDYDGEKALHWRSNYEKLLGRIREKYPNAWIICITTLLEHDPAWDLSLIHI